jgi:hypothetical protein
MRIINSLSLLLAAQAAAVALPEGDNTGRSSKKFTEAEALQSLLDNPGLLVPSCKLQWHCG